MFEKKKIISIEEVYLFSPPPDLTSTHWEHKGKKEEFRHIQKMTAGSHTFILKLIPFYLLAILLITVTREISIPKFIALTSPPFMIAIGYQLLTTKNLLFPVDFLFQRGVFIEKTFPELGPFFHNKETVRIHKTIIKQFAFKMGITYSAIAIPFAVSIFFLTKNLGTSVALALATLIGLILSLIACLGYKDLKQVYPKSSKEK